MRTINKARLPEINAGTQDFLSGIWNLHTKLENVHNLPEFAIDIPVETGVLPQACSLTLRNDLLNSRFYVICPKTSRIFWNVEAQTRDFTQFVWISNWETCKNWVVAQTCVPRPGNTGGSVSQVQQNRTPWAPKVNKNIHFSDNSLNKESQTRDFAYFVWRSAN